MKNTQTVAMSFFRYRGIQKIWGMLQMLGVRAPVRAMKGLQFFKPFGTGSGAGYSVWPDFNVYGLLTVWENEEYAEEFLNSGLYGRFTDHSAEQYTILLKPISSRGSWSGFSQWEFSEPLPTPLICALTRATLRFHFLFRFWRLVPGVSRDHEIHQGILFSRGVGEIPIFEQATFTIWENKEYMERFAYHSRHLDAIRKTREQKGFREEMFTRLQPFRTAGRWNGADPLENYLTDFTR